MYAPHIHWRPSAEVAMSESQKTDQYTLSDRTYKLLSDEESKPTYSGVLEHALVQEILGIEGKSVEHLLVGLLPRAASKAYVPISKYRVGAVSLGVSGNIYLGNNIEIPGQGLGFAVHAEQCAFTNAFMHGEREIKITAVTAAPCGHCRQFMTEFSMNMDVLIIIKDTLETKLGNLLPEEFGPRHLGNTHDVLQSPENQLRLFETFEAFDAEPKLEKAALEAACKSYAPYSSSPSGAAISTKRGNVYSGAYIESCAFNPSLPPLQAALVGLIQAGEMPEDITDCVVVELKDAMITQEDAARAVLRGVQPSAHFNLVYAQRD